MRKNGETVSILDEQGMTSANCSGPNASWRSRADADQSKVRTAASQERQACVLLASAEINVGVIAGNGALIDLFTPLDQKHAHLSAQHVLSV